MTPPLSKATLNRIAKDAGVPPALFRKFVVKYGITIVTAVQACRETVAHKQKADAAKLRA